MIYSGYFRGIKAPDAAALVESGAVSLMTAAVLYILTFHYKLSVGLFEISLIFAACSVLIFIIGTSIFMISCITDDHIGSTKSATVSTPIFRLERSLPFAIISVLPFINQFTPLLASGVILSQEDAGLFRMGERATIILSSPLLIISAILPPYLLKMYRAGQLIEIKNLALKISIWTASLGSIVLLLCVTLRVEIIELFGADFRSASDAFAIMALGQYVNLATGPVGLTLMMINKEKIVRNVNIVQTITGFVLYPIAFTLYGLTGGAIVYTILLSVQGLAMTVFMIRSTNISEKSRMHALSIFHRDR